MFSLHSLGSATRRGNRGRNITTTHQTWRYSSNNTARDIQWGGGLVVDGLFYQRWHTDRWRNGDSRMMCVYNIIQQPTDGQTYETTTHNPAVCVCIHNIIPPLRTDPQTRSYRSWDLSKGDITTRLDFIGNTHIRAQTEHGHDFETSKSMNWMHQLSSVVFSIQH
jgi:hypothetical protein